MKLTERIKAAFQVLAQGDELISSSDPRILDLFQIPRSDTGEIVSPETALRVAAVYACCNLIAGAIANMPIRFFRPDANGAPQLVPEHPLRWLFNEQPHDSWTAHSMWRLVLYSILLRGDGFVAIERQNAGMRGNIIGLKPFRPEQVMVWIIPDGSMRLRYYTSDGYTTKTYEAEDMLHFPGFGFNGARSMSVLQYGAFRSAGLGIASDRYAGKFFANGGTPRIVLKSPKKMTQPQIDELRNLWIERYGGSDNAHMPLVLTEGLEQQAVSISARDAQLIEARKFQVVDIARAFGVPPPLVGDMERTSSWGTGVEQMVIGFVRFTLQHHVSGIEQELNRKIFLRGPTAMRFDMSSLLRGDSKALADFYRQAIGGAQGPGWMTPNEVRAAEGMAPLDGGNVLFTAASPDAPGSAAPPATPAGPDAPVEPHALLRAIGGKQ